MNIENQRTFGTDFANPTPSVEDKAPIVKLAQVAKSLGIGRNTFFRQLREKKILNSQNVPADRYISAGYFKMKHRRYEDHGKQKFRDYYVTLVTPQGAEFLKEQFNPNQK